VGWETGYGLTVEIDHGYGIVTRYAHMSRTAVAVGESVRRGDRLGFVGTTGLATGPHLHYEVIVEGRPMDPLRFIMPAAIAD
jgi:murein DD-endopeptidase MepM/ murein hydrolase activator NlpD